MNKQDWEKVDRSRIPIVWLYKYYCEVDKKFPLSFEEFYMMWQAFSILFFDEELEHIPILFEEDKSRIVSARIAVEKVKNYFDNKTDW